MKILLLGRIDSLLRKILEYDQNEVLEWIEPIDVDFLKKHDIEFIVSYGYHYIIKRSVIECLEDRIINLHISYLPWNRGADPNFWSFAEDTPKGVSIHLVNEGVDAGDIIFQREVQFSQDGETLATTYNKLQESIVALFKETWPVIKVGAYLRHPQTKGGTYHKRADKTRFEHLLIKGWDTPVEMIIGKAKHA